MRDGVKLAADVWLPDARAPGRSRFCSSTCRTGRRRRAAGASRSTPTSSRHGYAVARVDIRGTGNSEGTLIPYEYSEIEQRDGEDVIAWLASPAVLERQRRDVRHLVGRVQLDPHGDAPPARPEGDHRRRRHRRPLPGRRALHGRDHARRLLGDEPGPRQRGARRAGLRPGPTLLRGALRSASVDAHVQGAAARRPVLGPHRAEQTVRVDPDSGLHDRRLVRRLSRQHPAHARAPEGARRRRSSAPGTTRTRTSRTRSPASTGATRPSAGSTSGSRAATRGS